MIKNATFRYFVMQTYKQRAKVKRNEIVSALKGIIVFAYSVYTYNNITVLRLCAFYQCFVNLGKEAQCLLEIQFSISKDSFRFSVIAVLTALLINVSVIGY